MASMKALFDFAAGGPGELSVRAGEPLVREAAESGGWIRVRRAAGAEAGFVPASYLEEVAAAPARPPPPPPPGQTAPPAPAPPEEENVAVEHAECLLCFDEMHKYPAAVFASAENRRTCPHFMHLTCAESLVTARHALCPACRRPFAKVRPVPAYDADPRGFFDAVDGDANGSLSKFEVVSVLKALLPIDYRALERDVDSFWTRWDTDSSGELSYEELCGPQGLLVYVRDKFRRSGDRPEPPPLNHNNLRAWFEYWDEDGSQELDKEEVVRALIKTFRLSTDLARVRETREMVDNIWGLFDHDGSGDVDINEFLQPDEGLGDTILANLAYSLRR
ncbi:hypothetical protein DFJ74DRAFT_239175 [Hyaloraphidium curvatum]|nr:hypothetical protein DFJ74DRAFT_239175 [Hyaloraphidium curvatum]